MMKSIQCFAAFALFGFLILTSACASESAGGTATAEAASEEFKWYTWEEAVEANKQNPKKIFVDVYTDWCGWCKKMDKATFQQPEVEAYLAKNFYSVKLDAEQKEAINFNGNEFKWVNAGRRGVHQLAYSLLDGKMSYPTVVYLNEKMEKIMVSPGYKDVEKFMSELSFAQEEAYTTMSYEDFKAKQVQ